MFALKNIAAREKGAPEGFRQVGQQVIQTGRAMEITALRGKERERLGLPKMPRTDSEAIRNMLKKVKLDELVKEKGGQ
jgi:heterodisulfide reductase subunit C